MTNDTQTNNTETTDTNIPSPSDWVREQVETIEATGDTRSVDIRRAASVPVCRSRTTARGIAMPAAAPRPCTKRSPIRTAASRVSTTK